VCSWSCSTAAAHPPNGGRPARHSTRSQGDQSAARLFHRCVSPICFWTRGGGDCSSLRLSTFTHSVLFPHLSKGSLWNFWRWFEAHETGSKWVNALASRCRHWSWKLLGRRANRPSPMRSRIDAHRHRCRRPFAPQADGSLANSPKGRLGLSASHPPAGCRHKLWRWPRIVSRRRADSSHKIQ
jgi:hypothetical protein